MNKLYNRVKVITPTVGTGTVTLSTAVSGFLTFAQGGVNTGEVVTYLLEEGTGFEVGQGIYTASGLTLTRDVVYRSTGTANIGKISLAGAATVAIVAAAEDILAPTRTNSLRNNSMQGIIAGSPGTLPTSWSTGSFTSLTRTIVGRGIENGIDYLDIRYNGTTGSTSGTLYFETNSQIAALDTEIWTTSAYLSLVAGALTNVTSVLLGVQTVTSGLSIVQTQTGSALVPTSTQYRFSRTYTLAGATTAFVYSYLQFTWTSGVAVDFTIRIGMPQLELGNGFTDIIRTNNNVAVTRNFGNLTQPPTPRQNFYSHLTVGSLLFVGTGNELAEDNANLFFDNINNRLGINTIVPEAPVQVGVYNSNSRIYISGAGGSLNDLSTARPTVDNSQIVIGRTTTTQAGGIEFIINSSGSGSGWKLTSPNFSSGADGSSFLFLARAGSATWIERLRITATGNVGVASNNPQTHLQIGATAGTFRVSNLFTDASNGEWFESSWAANVLNLGTNFNGSGVARALSIRAGGAEALSISTGLDVSATTRLSVKGANGSSTGIQLLTELVTIAAAATTDTTIQIPANALVIGVAIRVTVVIPTAATFDYGIAGATNRYGTGIAVAANTTNPGTNDGIRFYAGATAIRITPDLTPGANTGRVRVTIYYINIVPPTS